MAATAGLVSTGTTHSTRSASLGEIWPRPTQQSVKGAGGHGVR